MRDILGVLILENKMVKGCSMLKITCSVVQFYLICRKTFISFTIKQLFPISSSPSSKELKVELKQTKHSIGRCYYCFTKDN